MSKKSAAAARAQGEVPGPMMSIVKNEIRESKPILEVGSIIRYGKISVSPEGVVLEASQSIGECISEIKLNVTCVPHDDLTQAMKYLRVHLAQMCDLHEYRKTKPTDDPEGLYNIDVTGIIQKDGAVMLTGSKNIGTKVLNLNTPLYKDEDDYKYVEELQEAINAIQQEVHLLVTTGKVKFKQTELEFPEQEGAGDGEGGGE